MKTNAFALLLIGVISLKKEKSLKIETRAALLSLKMLKKLNFLKIDCAFFNEIVSNFIKLKGVPLLDLRSIIDASKKILIFYLYSNFDLHKFDSELRLFLSLVEVGFPINFLHCLFSKILQRHRVTSLLIF